MWGSSKRKINQLLVVLGVLELRMVSAIVKF